MLTIICGDDPVAARATFLSLRKEYEGKGYAVITVSPAQIADLPKWLATSQSLFAQKTLYTLEGGFSKKPTRDIILSYQKDPSVELLLLEENLAKKDIALYAKLSKIVSHPIPTSLFKFLDNLKPGNIQSLCADVNLLMNTDNQALFLYMVRARIRELLLIKKSSTLLPKKASWQIGILSSQAKVWDRSKLIMFLKGMYRIEKAIKSSEGFFNPSQMLKLLIASVM